MAVDNNLPENGIAKKCSTFGFRKPAVVGSNLTAGFMNMSRLIDTLKRVSQVTPEPMGFRLAKSDSPRPKAIRLVIRMVMPKVTR